VTAVRSKINATKAVEQAARPVASWFETRGVAALLTMRM
jgi:hypothetical protein